MEDNSCIISEHRCEVSKWIQTRGKAKPAAVKAVNRAAVVQNKVHDCPTEGHSKEMVAVLIWHSQAHILFTKQHLDFYFPELSHCHSIQKKIPKCHTEPWKANLNFFVWGQIAPSPREKAEQRNITFAKAYSKGKQMNTAFVPQSKYCSIWPKYLHKDIDMIKL